MKHAILGAGAIGGIVATALSSSGEEVLLIVRPEKVADHPSVLTWEHPSGPVRAGARPVGRLDEPVDVLWIATKTYQLDSALQLIQTSPHFVVPLLNGLDHIARLRERFGSEQVVPATIAIEAERAAPGHFVQRSFMRLAMSAAAPPALKEVVERLQSMGANCQFVENEATLMWSKLCFLEPFALATSASGKNIGEILSDQHWKSDLQLAVKEACVVASAEGATVEAGAILKGLESAPPAMRSSMAKDLAAGRRLELDAIAGAVVRHAKQHQIEVPVTSRLIAEIRSMDRSVESSQRL